MSLIREEIEQAIHTCIANPSQRVNSDKAANATKAVLSIIEKRIDSRLNEYLQKDWDDLYVKGLIEGLSNFKQEELKNES